MKNNAKSRKAEYLYNFVLIGVTGLLVALCALWAFYTSPQLRYWWKGYEAVTERSVYVGRDMEQDVEGLKDTLKDPESAKFRNIFSKYAATCGEVNSRNSFGGYTGYTRFIAISDTDWFMFENTTPNFTDYWGMFCTKTAP